MENKYKMMLFMKDFSKKVKYMVMEGVYILLWKKTLKTVKKKAQKLKLMDMNHMKAIWKIKNHMVKGVKSMLMVKFIQVIL